MYYGNPPLELDNGALRDVYTVLQLPSPDNTTLNKLRHIGKKFLGASFKPGVPSETLHEDVNDFFWSAIADEMVERAIDALARTHVCVSHLVLVCCSQHRMSCSYLLLFGDASVSCAVAVLCVCEGCNTAAS